MGKNAVGREGERLAAQYLRQTGYDILAANYRSRWGEIDIIARDQCGQIVFIEVKTRRSLLFGTPAAAVNRRKQARIRITAGVYLASCQRYQNAPVRFDVIEITLIHNTLAHHINHIQNAFY